MTSVIPFDFEAHQVRVVTDGLGESLFVAADVLSALTLDRKALERLDDDEKGVSSIHTHGGIQEVRVINESGLYSLVLGSRKPEAKRFKRWVTHSVLPSIRKTGSYNAIASHEGLLTPEQMKQVGGMMKVVSRKQMDESIADALARVLPSMMQAEMVKAHMSVRRGLTAGECWKLHGLPTKGLRGYSKWFSHRLTEVGCLMSDGRGELGLSTARLFDPDRVAAFMRGGFKATCERYIRERLGQKRLFSVAS